MRTRHLLFGHVLHFEDNPFTTPWGDAVQILENSALLIEDSRILAVGEAARTAAGPQAQVHDYKGKLILPGFVDAHAHFPRRR